MHRSLIKIAPVSAYFLLALLIAGCSHRCHRTAQPDHAGADFTASHAFPYATPFRDPFPPPCLSHASASPTQSATPTVTLTPTLTPLPALITDERGVSMLLVPRWPLFDGE